MLSVQGVQVQFLVGELRSHMLCSMTKKKKVERKGESVVILGSTIVSVYLVIFLCFLKVFSSGVFQISLIHFVIK